MIAYWDASAILPLFLREIFSEKAEQARALAVLSYSWHWTRVEVESGLLRRRASAVAWEQWQEFSSALVWLDAAPPHYEEICILNRDYALRAADAGHLFYFSRASVVMPELTLISFDEPLMVAAKQEGLHVWSGEPFETT